MHSYLRAAIPLLALVLAVAPAGAEDPDSLSRDEATPLDAVDPGDDGAPLADVPDVGPASPATRESRDLGAAPRAESLALDRAEQERGWRPTPCADLELALPPPPDAANRDAWTARLRTAQAAIAHSERALQRANAAYSRSLTSEEPLGQARADLIEARERARRDYSRARCALPAWLERARRAGVEPGVLRPFADG